jgi:hypothetical protein
MNQNTILKKSDKATFQIVADEAILIHMDSGTYFSLNKVGTELWGMLDGQAELAEHAVTIAQKYNVDTDMVITDFTELGERLLAEDLVETV